jgi:lipoyl-dependent peroxiredoxin
LQKKIIRKKLIIETNVNTLNLLTMKTIYTAEVTAKGGRRGHVKSSDGVLDMPVAIPEGMAGKGKATNPEQLFAAAYASCFQSALIVAAHKIDIRLDPESTVKAKVSLREDNQYYGLSIILEVDLKGLYKEQAQELTAEAHEICPYSAGIQGKMEVELNVV